MYMTTYLKEIFEEKGHKAEIFEEDYVLRIDEKYYMVGSSMPINNYAAAKLCNDKTATSHMLSLAGIPSVQHELIYRGDKDTFVLKPGKFVVKPNEGSEGINVFLVENEEQLKEAFSEIFQKKPMACISEFYNIQKEIRCFVLNSELLYAYEKVRPYTLADGIHSITELTDGRIISEIVPKTGEKVLLEWKHNLFSGATPELIENPSEELKNLAISVAKALDITFASVDVILTDNKYMILEVNANVCCHFFKEKYEKETKNIYEKAVDYFLAHKN